MSVNLDADIGQVIKNFLNKKGKKTDPKSGKVKTPSFAKIQYKQALIKSIIVICVAAVAAWGISFLTKSSVKRVQSEFTSLIQLDEAVAKIEQDIISSKDLLAKNSKKVEEILPMFSDIEGSKSLFKLVSNIAEANNLIIKNLSQGEIIETTSPAKYTQTNILLEIEGFYPNYMKFKNQLAAEKPMIRIESENVSLHISSTGERRIGVDLSFIDYSVQKQEYEKILQK